MDETAWYWHEVALILDRIAYQWGSVAPDAFGRLVKAYVAAAP